MKLEILEENPNDQEHVLPRSSVIRSSSVMLPYAYGADRAFASPENEHAWQQAGVVVSGASKS